MGRYYALPLKVWLNGKWRQSSFLDHLLIMSSVRVMPILMGSTVRSIRFLVSGSGH